MKDNEIIELYWTRDESAISATADAYGNYDGIIYESTVCPIAKNIVLFNKEYAKPFGDVQDYIIPSQSLATDKPF